MCVVLVCLGEEEEEEAKPRPEQNQNPMGYAAPKFHPTSYFRVQITSLFLITNSHKKRLSKTTFFRGWPFKFLKKYSEFSLIK